MRPASNRAQLLSAATVAGMAGVAATRQASLGDYPSDAGPAIKALIEGHLHQAISQQPLMGSFAVLARAPFALAAHAGGAGELGVYRAGAVACLAAVALLAIALVRRSGTRDWLPWFLVPALAVMTPVSVAAVQAGHPEEALAAALSVGAVVAAGRRAIVAGLLLGLALATKQWTVLAIGPALMAAPRGTRLKLVATALPVAAVFTLPLLADPAAFSRTAQNAAGSVALASRMTLWFLVAHPVHNPLHLGPGMPSSLTTYRLDSWVTTISHPLIVLVSPVLTLALWRRRRQPGDPLALLALFFLLRCVLDPADNDYYHLPLVVSLLAYETVVRPARRVPVVTLYTVGGLWLVWNVLDLRGATPQVTNAVYLTCMAGVAAYLLHALRLLQVPLRAALARDESQASTTRVSSSIDVSPPATLARPSSHIVRMPPRIAARSISSRGAR